MPDREILQKAKEENRVLLTVDLDFANLVSEWGSDTLPPTVVIFRLPVVRASALIGSFPQLCFVLGNIPDDKAAIISVTKERIRLRNLPI